MDKRWFCVGLCFVLLFIGFALVIGYLFLPVGWRYRWHMTPPITLFLFLVIIVWFIVLKPAKPFGNPQFYKKVNTLLLTCLVVTMIGMIFIGGREAYKYLTPLKDTNISPLLFPSLVEPHTPSVKEIASGFSSLCQAYKYVQKMPYIPDSEWGYVEYFQSASETLKNDGGDCEDKVILLVSIWRAMGVPRDNVWVVIGLNNEGGAHAWVQLKTQGIKVFQIDPTSDIVWESYVPGYFSDGWLGYSPVLFFSDNIAWTSPPIFYTG